MAWGALDTHKLQAWGTRSQRTPLAWHRWCFPFQDTRFRVKGLGIVQSWGAVQWRLCPGVECCPWQWCWRQERSSVTPLRVPKLFIAKALKPTDCSLRFYRNHTNVISLFSNCSFSQPLFTRLLGICNPRTIVSLLIRTHLSFCIQPSLFVYNTTKIISYLPGRLAMIM